MEDKYEKTVLGEDDGIELELALSLGGSFKKSEKLKPIGSNESDNNEKNKEVYKERDVTDLNQSCSKTDLGGAWSDPRTKREIQALRRQEAKKKREAKQQRRGVSALSRERNGELSNGERDFKRAKTEEDNGVNLNLSIQHNAAPNFVPFVRACGNAVPVTHEENGKDVNMSTSNIRRTFGPYQVGQKDPGLKSDTGYVTEQRLTASCSSSEVSDPNSSSLQGSSCDSGSNCGQTIPDHPPVAHSLSNNTSQSTRSHQTETTQSSDASPAPVHPTPAAAAENSAKPPKPIPLPFGNMPCVTTVGDGANGRRVNGFLYRYSKSEISIVCVCHGGSFSPAEFVRHAGGGDVAHPLRHITVVPSPI